MDTPYTISVGRFEHGQAQDAKRAADLVFAELDGFVEVMTAPQGDRTEILATIQATSHTEAVERALGALAEIALPMI